jgi:FkbM family methyltransferase
VSDASVVTAETPFGTLACHPNDQFITPHLQRWGVWEPAETAYLRWRLQPGMTFVDVGAHVGYFSVLASTHVGEHGAVIAFEPDPSNFRLLEENLRRNGCRNARALPWAVGDSSGRRLLHRATHNTGDHRTYARGEPRPTVPVRQVALDRVPFVRAPLDVVKIDVQGSEAGVIGGMESLIRASPKMVMLVEFWPPGFTRYGSDADDLLAYYRSLAFAIEVQYPDAPFPRPLDRDELLYRCPTDDDCQSATLVLSRHDRV